MIKGERKRKQRIRQLSRDVPSATDPTTPYRMTSASHINGLLRDLSLHLLNFLNKYLMETASSWHEVREEGNLFPVCLFQFFPLYSLCVEFTVKTFFTLHMGVDDRQRPLNYDISWN